MDSATYLKESARTASSQFHAEIVDPAMLEATLLEAIQTGHLVDAIKKSLFYGKPIAPDHGTLRVKGEPTRLDPARINPDLLHAALGLYTEAAEMLESALAAMRGEPFDAVNAFEECGDIEWYLAMNYRALGRTPEEAKAANIEKLRARYPKQFESSQAIERDLHTERRILEQHTKPDLSG
jgi:hypothetical protein